MTEVVWVANPGDRYLQKLVHRLRGSDIDITHVDTFEKAMPHITMGANIVVSDVHEPGSERSYSDLLIPVKAIAEANNEAILYGIVSSLRPCIDELIDDTNETPYQVDFGVYKSNKNIDIKKVLLNAAKYPLEYINNPAYINKEVQNCRGLGGYDTFDSFTSYKRKKHLEQRLR